MEGFDSTSKTKRTQIVVLEETEIVVCVVAKQNKTKKNATLKAHIKKKQKNKRKMVFGVMLGEHGFERIEAPNLLYMIDHINRLSLWVATEILSRENPQDMAEMCKFFYFVAQRCYELFNLHTCLAIVGGITYRSVKRIKRLERFLMEDERFKQYYELFEQLASDYDNYKT